MSGIKGRIAWPDAQRIRYSLALPLAGLVVMATVAACGQTEASGSETSSSDVAPQLAIDAQAVLDTADRPPLPADLPDHLNHLSVQRPDGEEPLVGFSLGGETFILCWRVTPTVHCVPDEVEVLRVEEQAGRTVTVYRYAEEQTPDPEPSLTADQRAEVERFWAKVPLESATPTWLTELAEQRT